MTSSERLQDLRKTSHILSVSAKLTKKNLVNSEELLKTFMLWIQLEGPTDIAKLKGTDKNIETVLQYRTWLGKL